MEENNLIPEEMTELQETAETLEEEEVLSETEENEYEENEYEEDEAPAGPPPVANFTVMTELGIELQKEASNAVRTKLSSIIAWASSGLLAAIGGLLIWQYIQSAQKMYLIELLVVVLVLVYFVYNRTLGQTKALKKWEAGIQQKYGTNAFHLVTDFYDLILAQETLETGSDVEIGYSSISEWKETEKLFLLRYGKDNWFFIQKDGFTKGDPDSFRAFLNEKLGSGKTA